MAESKRLGRRPSGAVECEPGTFAWSVRGVVYRIGGRGRDRAGVEGLGYHRERERVLPGLRDIDGFVDAYVLRRDSEDEVEITTITLFASMESIRAFAGEDPSRAHVTPEARRLLSRFEETVVHHDVAIAPQTG